LREASTDVSVDVLTKRKINRPIGEVSYYAIDPTNAPVWYANIKSVEWKTPPPLEVGSRVAFEARFLGRRLTYTYEIVELEPLRKLVMSTAEGPFPMETTYTWETVDTGTTRMTLRNRGEPSGLAKWMAPLVARLMRRANNKDLAMLKSILEGEAAK
jgi:hypothetical protein